jgi:ABC-type transporter Mla MlaB component
MTKNGRCHDTSCRECRDLSITCSTQNQLIAENRIVRRSLMVWQAGCSCRRANVRSAEEKDQHPENLMPIRVTEIENRLSGATGLGGPNNAELNSINIESDEIVLMVEGTLYKRDAELLERICRDLASQTRKGIKLELSNLSFLDSDSAAVLCSLKRELGVSLEGLQLFIEKVVELAEESDKVDRYRPRTVNDRVSPS